MHLTEATWNKIKKNYEIMEIMSEANPKHLHDYQTSRICMGFEISIYFPSGHCPMTRLTEERFTRVTPTDADQHPRDFLTDRKFEILKANKK